MSGNSNESTALSRIFADVPQYAYAMSMGKDTLTDVGDRLFRGALSEPEAFTLDVVGKLYDEIHLKASEIGRAKGKPMKDQTRKSRNSQVSKLGAFPLVATLAQESDAVEPAYSWLRLVPLSEGDEGLGISGYVKVVKALVAIKEAIAIDADASELDLRDAIVAALAPKQVAASDAVDAMADAWDTLVNGSEKSPALYEAEFHALLAANANDPAKQVGERMREIAAAFRARENLAAEKARLASGGLSI